MINDILLLVLSGSQRLSEAIRKELHGKRVFKKTSVDMTFIAIDVAHCLQVLKLLGSSAYHNLTFA